MEDLSSSQKSSGLLARIQALQAQDLSKNDEAETVIGSFNSTPDEEFNFPDNDNPFEDSIYPEPDIPLNSEDAFTLGDYTLNQPEEETPVFDSIPDENTDFSDNLGTDPDFSFNETTTLGTDPENNLDSFETDNLGTDPDFSFNNDDIFGEEPDFDTPDTPAEPVNSFSSGSSGGLSFTGLYDKETIMGDSSDQTTEIQKKTRVPVIICVVCAAICLLATTLILFIIPSRYNLITKKTVKVDDNTIIIESESHNPEEKKNDNSELQKLIDNAEVPPAKENEVVVVEKAEEVIPTPPVVDKSSSKNEQYKIKWGDTLWDISNTYYKTPWKYKKIASYNKISNPDYIISGTTITIPAE